jgi:hypothetical protein
MKIKNKREKTRTEVPAWCTQFRCKIVKTATSLDQIQRIAGRQQATASNVKQQTMTASMLQALASSRAETDVAARENRDVRHNLTNYRWDAYTKSGRPRANFSHPVCRNCETFPSS